MFGSKASAFNVVDATPYKRDILKQLAERARGKGCARLLLLAVAGLARARRRREYLGFRTGRKEGLRRVSPRKRRSRRSRSFSLSTGRGAHLVRHAAHDDGGARETVHHIVRELQPSTLIDGRLGAEGDYMTTGDNVIPPNVQGAAWETPATINHTWGYRKDDTDWKSPGEIVFKLMDIVSKGGNYLLNVGPMADGTIPSAEPGHPPHGRPLAADERRRRVRRRADAVRRRARRSQQDPQRRPRRTARVPAKRLPLHDEARQAVHHVLRRAPRAVRAAGDEEHRDACVLSRWRSRRGARSAMRKENGRTYLDIDRPIPEPMASVVVVEHDGGRIEPIK
jgi:alpha-L-fucosidase